VFDQDAEDIFVTKEGRVFRKVMLTPLPTVEVSAAKLNWNANWNHGDKGDIGVSWCLMVSLNPKIATKLHWVDSSGSDSCSRCPGVLYVSDSGNNRIQKWGILDLSF
jgi:hypothetical protein